MRVLACLLVLIAFPAHARTWGDFVGVYNLRATIKQIGCGRSDLGAVPADVFPQLTITGTRRRRAVGTLDVVTTRDPLLMKFAALRYFQRVRGRLSPDSWSMKQIDSCVLFNSPPPRRCGVMVTEMRGLPDADHSVLGALVLQFHNPFEKPDCSIRWEGNWTR